MTDSINESYEKFHKQYLRSRRMHKAKRPVFGPSKSVVMHVATKTRSNNKVHTSTCQSDSCVLSKNDQHIRNTRIRNRRLTVKSTKFYGTNNKKRVSQSLKYYISGKYMPPDYCRGLNIKERNYGQNAKKNKNASISSSRTATKSKSLSTTKIKTKHSKLIWKSISSYHDAKSIEICSKKEGILISSIGDGRSKCSNKISRVTFKDDRRAEINYLLLTAMEVLKREDQFDTKQAFKLNVPKDTSTPISVFTHKRYKPRLGADQKENKMLPHLKNKLQKYDKQASTIHKLNILKLDTPTTSKIKSNVEEYKLDKNCTAYLCSDIHSDNNQGRRKISTTTLTSTSQLRSFYGNKAVKYHRFEKKKVDRFKLEMEKANALQLELEKAKAQKSELKKPNAQLLKFERANAAKLEIEKAFAGKIKIDSANSKKSEIDKVYKRRFQIKRTNKKNLQIDTTNVEKEDMKRANALKESEDIKKPNAAIDKFREVEVCVQEKEKKLETITLYSKKYLAKPYTDYKLLKDKMSIKYDKKTRSNVFNNDSRKKYRKLITKQENVHLSSTSSNISSYNSNLQRNVSKKLSKEHKDEKNYIVSTSSSSNDKTCRSSNIFSFSAKISSSVMKKPSSSIISLGGKMSRVIKDFGLKSWHFFSKSSKQDLKHQMKNRLNNLPKRKDLYLAITGSESSNEDIRKTRKG